MFDVGNQPNTHTLWCGIEAFCPQRVIRKYNSSATEIFSYCRRPDILPHPMQNCIYDQQGLISQSGIRPRSLPRLWLVGVTGLVYDEDQCKALICIVPCTAVYFELLAT
jgi:hypothetical protein